MPIDAGLARAVQLGRDIGCRVIQVFTKSPQQWRARDIAPEDAEAFRAANAQLMAAPPVAHDSYLINLATSDPDLLERSRQAFLHEMERCHQLGIPVLVTHMGSFANSTEEDGLARLRDSLNHILDRAENLAVSIALETTAGQGNSLGSRLEQFPRILEGVRRQERLALCVDTCHVFAAGYDIRTLDGLNDLLERIGSLVGLDRLRVIHLNDSRRELGSRVDRHEHIGQGQIGEAAFRALLLDERLARVPKIVETPMAKELHAYNLAMLRWLVGLGDRPQMPAIEPRPARARRPKAAAHPTAADATDA